MENVAVCKYCGQVFMVPGKTPEEQETQAIAKCNCVEAQAVQRKWRYIDEAKVKLAEAFSFNPFGENAISDEDEGIRAIETALEEFIPFLADLRISQISISVCNFGKINLATNAEGRIKIKKTVGATFESKV